MLQVIGLGSGGNTWGNANSIIQVMRKWKWLVVNGSEHKRPVSIFLI